LLIRELPHLLRLLGRLIRDPRVALLDKLIFGFVVAYTLTPVDLIPDILSPLGLVDDLYLLGLSLARMFARAGPDLLLEHWDGEPAALGYLVEGVEQIGGLLPGPVRRVLRRSIRRTG
jgi:uncharacterized membrane protein YkvA (DUF1232 family)